MLLAGCAALAVAIPVLCILWVERAAIPDYVARERAKGGMAGPHPEGRPPPSGWVAVLPLLLTFVCVGLWQFFGSFAPDLTWSDVANPEALVFIGSLALGLIVGAWATVLAWIHAWDIADWTAAGAKSLWRLARRAESTG